MEVEGCDTNLSLSIGGVGRQLMSCIKRNECKEKPPINQLQEKEDEEEEEEDDYSVRKRRSKSRSEDTVTANQFNVNSGYRGGRKKLRLSKEQIGLLEDSFMEHNTLNSVSISMHANVSVSDFGSNHVIRSISWL